MEVSTAQTVVKVFAVLHWIGAALGVIGGLAFVVTGPAMLAMMDSSEMMGFGALAAGAAVAIGVFLVVLSLVGAFVGYGLWQHKNWARIVVLIFGVLGVLSIFSMNIPGVIIGGLQIWLFGFDKTVIGLFI